MKTLIIAGHPGLEGSVVNKKILAERIKSIAG